MIGKEHLIDEIAELEEQKKEEEVEMMQVQSELGQKPKIDK